MTVPVRLRLSRAKGFDLQAVSRALNGLEAVNVARPTKWGNPFTVANSGGVHPALRYACEYARYVDARPLRGKNLACWCGLEDQHGNYVPCHADVLLSLANDVPMDEVIRENTRRAKGETVR